MAKIDVVEEEPNHDGIISYRLMDNDKEDMIHIRDTLFNKFEREEIKQKKDIFSLDEILECVKLQLSNSQNYEQVEKAIIYVLLLDSVTNNGDRHAFNWALVRNKKTNYYDLAVFDHSSTLIDMLKKDIFRKPMMWNGSYITVGEDKGKTNIGSNGEKLVNYIFKNYPEYFEGFSDIFEKRIPTIIEQLRKENMNIDVDVLYTKLREKNRFLHKLKSKGELEYE